MTHSHLRRISPAKSREKSPSLNDQAGHGTQRGRCSAAEVGQDLQEVPPEDGCAYFMAMGDKAREEIERKESK